MKPCGGELDCNDDCMDLQSGLSRELVAGQTLILVVGGYSGGTGNFVLNISDAGITPLECSATEGGTGPMGGTASDTYDPDWGSDGGSDSGAPGSP